MKQLRFFRDDLAERHGFSMQRIPLDPGFACPHGRCAFCGADGSRAHSYRNSRKSRNSGNYTNNLKVISKSCRSRTRTCDFNLNRQSTRS